MSSRYWPSLSGADAKLACLLSILVLLSCASLNTAFHNTGPGQLIFWHAVATTFMLLSFVPLFLKAQFGFGYLAGISFYSMIVGFFWYTYFSIQQYDHVLSRWSAVASLLLFLLPALFQTRPLPRMVQLSPRNMDRLAVALICIAAVVLTVSASYGFALVGLVESGEARGTLSRPTILNYLIGWTTGAVLPYVFAYVAWRRRYVLAGIAIVLICGFYPVVLNKSVVFGCLWLPFLFILFRLFEPKRATIYALLIAMIPGIIAYNLIAFGWLSPDRVVGHLASFLIGNVNVRWFAYPSIVLNQYSDFFANHPLTYFCQIGAVRAIYGCPYPFQLGATMAEAYNMGNLNGSLFATEGIASVGTVWAPLSALVCGLIVSLGNSASARLPASFVATSAGLAVQQALLNAPLSVSLLSNGVLVLWLLWAVTPDFEQKASE
jgi:hypothetical protein